MAGVNMRYLHRTAPAVNSINISHNLPDSTPYHHFPVMARARLYTEKCTLLRHHFESGRTQGWDLLNLITCDAEIRGYEEGKEKRLVERWREWEGRERGLEKMDAK